MATPIFYGHLQRSPSLKGGGGGILDCGEGGDKLWFGDINCPPRDKFLSWKRTICYLDILHDITYKRYLSTIKMFHRVTFIFYLSCSDKGLHIVAQLAVIVWLARLGDAIVYSVKASIVCFYFCY